MWTSEERAGDSGDYIDSVAYTVQSILQLLQHDQVDLLKIDVEGAEYEIIESLESAKHLPKQILDEYHHRFPGIGNKKTLASIEFLKKLGYKIFDVSETGREVAFVLSE